MAVAPIPLSFPAGDIMRRIDRYCVETGRSHREIAELVAERTGRNPDDVMRWFRPSRSRGTVRLAMVDDVFTALDLAVPR